MKNYKPLVSVCCITYNHAKYIKECLDGFLMQKVDFDVEFLIHDDASTDNTQQIIKELVGDDSRFKLILRETNIKSTGVAVFPLLYQQAQGKYIALCEGDDYWTDPLKLQKQVDFLEANEEYVLTTHRCYEKRGQEMFPDKLNFEQKIRISLIDAIYQSYWHTPSVVFRNLNILKKLPEFMQTAMPGDKALFLLLMKSGGLGHYSSEVMGCYRLHSGGLWSSDSGKRHNFAKAITGIRLYEYLNIEDYDVRLAPFYMLADVIAKNGYVQIQRLQYLKELFNFFGFKVFLIPKRVYLLFPRLISKLHT
jgi:glycosyltransferase involved in cell wall biosynthesis